MKNITHSQASISINCCTGLSNTVFPCASSLEKWFTRFTLKNSSNILLTIQLTFFEEKAFFLFLHYFDIVIL